MPARPWLLLLALCMPVLAGAGDAGFPMRADALPLFVPKGMTVETQLEADFDKDGTKDIAAVIRGEDVRYLLVALREGKGLRRAGLGELDAYPLGAASLRMAKDVLLVEDLTGGTTAISSKYRYRHEAASGRIRLIGDDVTLYSRTNNHDQTEISTNRLTGDRITIIGRLKPDGSYTFLPPKRSKLKPERLYLENAPAPEATLDIGG